MRNKLKRATVIALIAAILISLCSAAAIYFLNSPKGTSESAPTPSRAESTEPAETYVENRETEIEILRELKVCLYTGMINSDGECTGEGHYETENDDGSMCVFEGTSLSNRFYNGTIENYPIYYGNSQLQYISYYTGALANGLPDGKGTLTLSGTGNDFTYSGSWSAGKYDGYGELIYSDSNIMEYKGNFKDGTFRPTFSQLVNALCSTGTFEMTPGASEYVSENESAFLDHDSSNANFDTGLIVMYNKSAENPDNRSFKTSISVVQKTEYPEETFGYPITEILGYSESEKMIYYGYYFGYSDSIAEGEDVTITGYPLGYGNYYESAGNETVALRFLAYEVE